MSAIRLFGTDVTQAIPDIDPRQFGQGLWMGGLISYEEFIAFVGQGTIPPALAKALADLPDDDTGAPTPRKLATGLITGALSYQRANPLVDQLAA